MNEEKMNEGNVNTQQDPTNAYYYDPLTAQGGKPVKSKSRGATIVATIVAAIVFFMFGAIGGLICYGGYWAVLAIAKSKLPTAAKVILGVVVGLAFVILLVVFIFFVAGLQQSMQ